MLKKILILPILAILVIVSSIPAQTLAQIQTGNLYAESTTGFLVVKKIVNGGPVGPEAFWIHVTTVSGSGVSASPSSFRGSASTVVQITNVPKDGTVAIVHEDESPDYKVSVSGCFAGIYRGQVSYCTITNTYVGNPSTTPSNGPIESPWGFVIFPNGTVILLNRTNNYPVGTILYPNGTLVYPKTPVAPLGPTTTPSGAIVFPNGTIIAGGASGYPKGTIMYPNGTNVFPNGTITRPSSQTTPNPGGGSSSKEHSSIPGWIKNSAKWWSEGQTSDKEYATSIGWLAENGMINIQSQGSQGSAVVVSDNIQIPSWVKNDAKWWAAGSIDDATYAQSIQYLLNSNIITFSKSNLQTQTASTTYDVGLKIVDSTTGQPVDALVTVTTYSNPVTVETDRDGIAHFSLSAGDYQVQVDSQNYQRLNENLAVTGDIQQTYQIQSIQGSSTTNPTTPQTGESTSNTTPQTTPTNPSQQTQGAQVSVSPTSVIFIHNYFTSCPQPITQVNLQSDQQGTWNVASSPSWTQVAIQGNGAIINFNCNLNQAAQSLTGTVTFVFTNSQGVSSPPVSVSISGQINVQQ